VATNLGKNCKVAIGPGFAISGGDFEFRKRFCRAMKP
jgi:hypothetical protein